MATRNVQIIVSVRDAATKPMKKVERQIRNTGKAAKSTTNKFKDFNRTLFATTAFVGTFIKAFSAMSNSLVKGAELDRLETQFERVLGPSSNLIQNIKSMTDVAVDRMEAMRSGIALANLGITNSSEDTAKIIAMSGVAARQAGLDSGEGVKRVTQFLKDGSVSQLEFLNVLRSTNPRLQAQLSILNSTAGPMGKVISTQAKLRIGMNLLNAVTQGNMKGFRDLGDVVTQMRDSFGNFTRTIGRFIGAALGPMIDSFSLFFDKISSTLDHIRKNEKEIVFLSKAMIIGTGATLGLVGALGTLRLATMALGSLGFGLPMLITLAAGVGAAFLGVTAGADSMMDRLKLFGGFVRGVWQLVTNLDEETGFAKIDKELADMLRKNGILEFTQNVARAISVVKSFATGLVSGLASAIRTTISAVEKLMVKFRAITGMDSKGPWSMSWLTNAKSFGEALGKYVLPVLAGIAAFKFGKNLLSKIPIVGKLFGGGGDSAGKGNSASNPMYTKEVGGVSGAASTLSRGVFGRRIGAMFRLWRMKFGSAFVMPVKRFLLGRAAGLSMAFDLIKNSVVGRLLPMFKNMTAGMAKMIPQLGRAAGGLGAAALAGYAIGKVIEPYVTDALNKHTTSTNADGFEGNILERGFFALDKMFGGETSKKFIDGHKAQAKFNAASDKELIAQHNAKNPGKRSQISVPVQPSGEDAQLDYLGNQMKAMQGAEQERFAEAIKTSRASGGPGGMDITPQEWGNIFLGALEASENLKAIADKAKKPEDSLPSRQRRGLL